MALLLLTPSLNKKYPFYVFSFAVLFLFLALRYDFGNDYMNYYIIHTNINAGVKTWGNEDVLYRYINLLIPNFYLFVTVLSAFYISTILFMIRKNLKKSNYWLAVLILLINPYLFLVHLSSFRQTIAICIVILAVHFLTKKKRFIYILLIIIAAGFHISAVLVLPIFILINQKKVNFIYFLVIIGGLILLLFSPLFDFGIKWALDFFPQNYTFYYEQGSQNSLRATLISSFFFFLVIFNINKLEGKEIIYGKLSLIGTIISLLAYKLSMLTRIGMYFDVFLIVSLPLILSRIENKYLKVLLFLITLFIFILRYWSFFNNIIWSDSYNEYKSILNK